MHIESDKKGIEYNYSQNYTNSKIRELDFVVKKAIRKSAYGVVWEEYFNVDSLPINEYRDFYESEYGILYIHDGKGKLSLEFALKPLLSLKQAMLYPSFINELDKALIGERSEPKFRSAINEFLALQDVNHDNLKVYNKDFAYLTNKLIATIKPCKIASMKNQYTKRK